jgi:hypothetical protein
MVDCDEVMPAGRKSLMPTEWVVIAFTTAA